MKLKSIFISLCFLTSLGALGQVLTGVNTQEPTETLDVNGNARVRNINANTGNPETDKVVVADADGVLKTIDNTPSIHYFSGHIGGGQSINAAVNATSTAVNLQFPNTQYVTATGVTANASFEVFTITEPGVYELSVQAQFDGEPANWSGTGDFHLWMLMQIEINAGSGFQPAVSSRTIFVRENLTTSFIPTNTIANLSAGDQIRVRVVRGGGHNRSGGGNAEAKYKHLIIKKIS